MSFHVQDNFKPGAPISQVPASWFNKVAAFLNGLVPGRGINFNKQATGATAIELKDEFRPVSKAVGTPSDHTDTPEVLDTDGDSWTWTAGGANGLKLDAYYQIGVSGSYHLFQRCRLTISRDGLIVSAQGLPDRIRVRA